MKSQEYPLVNNVELASLIRTNMLGILEGIENKSISINKDINKLGQNIFNYNKSDLLEKNLEYFSGLPGQKILIVNNLYEVEEISFLEFLKTFKYTWYCKFFRYDKESIFELSKEERNLKPETRNKVKDNAIFIDVCNNPILFIFKPSCQSLIIYLKLNTVEYPELSYYLYNIIRDNNILDNFTKSICETLKKYSFTNIIESFRNKTYTNELMTILENIYSLNEYFSKMTLLLDIITKHKNVVDKSKENNLLVKKNKLLEETCNSYQNLNMKLDSNFKMLSNNFNKKVLDYNNLQKDNLELENKYLLLLKSKKLDKIKKRKLRNCNALYFSVLLLLLIILFFLDYVLKPNKEEILEKCKVFLLNSFSQTEL